MSAKAQSAMHSPWVRSLAVLIATAAIGSAIWAKLGRAGDSPRLTGSQMAGTLASEAAAQKFSGVVHGWHVMPFEEYGTSYGHSVSRALDCTRTESLETDTSEDPNPTYLPPGTDAPAIERIACPDGVRQVTKHYSIDTAYGDSALTIERFVWDKEAWPIDASQSRVTAGFIDGIPSILVEPLHESGFGRSVIVMLEEAIDPVGWITVLTTDDLPFLRLKLIAESLQ